MKQYAIKKKHNKTDINAEKNPAHVYNSFSNCIDITIKTQEAGENIKTTDVEREN